MQWIAQSNVIFYGKILFLAIIPTSLSENMSNILKLNGSNYLGWHDQVLIALECWDLKLCLQMNVPSQPTNTSTLVEKVLYESRKNSNNLSMMIIYSKEHSSVNS